MDGRTTPVTPPTGFLGLFSRSKPVFPPPGTLESGQVSGRGLEENEETEGEWQVQGNSRQNSSSPPKSFSEAARQGAQERAQKESQGHSNLPERPKGPNPNFIHRHTTPIFEVRNQGAFRDEIEIEIRTINEKPFRGTVTTREAKHIIYKEIIGGPFSNFRGLRFGFKGVPVVTIMLKEPINIDDLQSIQFFEFTRSYSKQGKEVVDVLACKIRGVRTVTGGEATASYSEDWTRVVKIEGCDYRVPEELILAWLRQYGEILSDLVEDVFEDNEDSEGTNATGIYSVKMKLFHNIPQLLPMAGRRIKIYYRGIQKLCTRCFGHHIARNCTTNKVPWLNYVGQFIESNPEVDSALFGKWITILEREKNRGDLTTSDQGQPITEEQSQPSMADGGSNKDGGVTESHELRVASAVADCLGEEDLQNQGSQLQHQGAGNVDAVIQTDQEEPLPSDFNIPVDDAEEEKLITKMMECGMSSADATANIEKRKKLFNQAIKKYTAAISKKARQTKSRKNSLNDH